MFAASQSLNPVRMPAVLARQCLPQMYDKVCEGMLQMYDNVCEGMIVLLGTILFLVVLLTVPYIRPEPQRVVC